MMFTAGLFSSLNAVYNVVDLPEPVGPVTKISPSGRLIIFLKTPSSSSDIPSREKSYSVAFLSITRMTHDSPNKEGRMDTRSSSKQSLPLYVKAPSCGILFSAIFRLDRTLIREMIVLSATCSTLATSRSSPSILIRIRISFSLGLIWISEAFVSAARSRSILMNSTIGPVPSVSVSGVMAVATDSTVCFVSNIIFSFSCF